jgi:hypothetical protein
MEAGRHAPPGLRAFQRQRMFSKLSAMGRSIVAQVRLLGRDFRACMFVMKNEQPRPTTPPFEQIAREKLRIHTLETRNSDHLDFYDVSVWQVRAALEAAFEAGRAAAKEE